MEASAVAQLCCLVAGLFRTIFASAMRSLLLMFKSNDQQRQQQQQQVGFALYEGRVWHERRHPVLHRFEYQVRYALIDLDEAPEWFHSTAAASHHMTAENARSIAGTDASVHLLTVPTSVGYEQNPLSVYYCYSKSDNASGQELAKCIAEVTNTPWAERVTFVFEPGQDAVAKPLHVSPFMDMFGTWKIEAGRPSEKLHIVINVQHPDFGNYFCAKLNIHRVEGSDPERFFWLMPHKVAFWIYWQALLLISKGVAFISHPKYTDGSAYRDRARQRDQVSSGKQQGRYFDWREAPCWPWK